MSTITFSQATTASGQIALTLSSADLPAGGFAFALALNYSGKTVLFNKVTYSGSASSSISANYVGSIGSVNINGSLAPSSGTSFATILFDAIGTGSFNADILNLRVNGSDAVFTDPAAYSFSIFGEAASIQAGGAAFGTYMPLEVGFFTLTYTLKSVPEHGNVVFGEAGNPSAWKYTPAAGFYGADFFTLKVSDWFDTKEKSIAINVSPVGTPGNDTFHSSAATYHVDGGTGIDAIQYMGKSSDFIVSKTSTGFVITDKTGMEGASFLDNFERLTFSDTALALDINGNGGQAYRIYQAAFNRVPDAAGLGYWISVLDKGTMLVDVAGGFMNSAEFKAIYGAAPSNSQLVTKFYENILHRQPEQAGLDYWVGVLDTKGASEAAVLANISESAENQAGLVSIIGNGFTYASFGG